MNDDRILTCERLVETLDDYLDGRFQAIGSSTNAIKQNFGRAPKTRHCPSTHSCKRFGAIVHAHNSKAR